MRNQKGITLIALIVTIIVLIIIAGISIATLTADNGILRQTDSAKIASIEGTAREEVDLACAAMRLAIAEAQAKNNNYNAKLNANKIQTALLAELNADKSLKGTWAADGSTVTDGSEVTSFDIKYTGEDYSNACNNPKADINVTINLAQGAIYRFTFTGEDTQSTVNAIKPSEIGG